VRCDAQLETDRSNLIVRATIAALCRRVQAFADYPESAFCHSGRAVTEKEIFSVDELNPQATLLARLTRAPSNFGVVLVHLGLQIELNFVPILIFRKRKDESATRLSFFVASNVRNAGSLTSTYRVVRKYNFKS
jgi:hypothetical protein